MSRLTRKVQSAPIAEFRLASVKLGKSCFPRNGKVVDGELSREKIVEPLRTVSSMSSCQCR